MKRIFDILIVSIFSFFAVIFDMVSLPFHLIIDATIFKMSRSKIRNVREVKIGDSQCKTYICTGPNTKQEDHGSGLDTVFSLMKFSVSRHRYSKCLGTREILNEKEFYRPDGVQITKYVIGPYNWKTYNAVNDEILLLSRGLRSLGVEPKMALVILLETRAEWIVSAMACFKTDITLVVLDISMDLLYIAQSLKEVEPLAMITSEEQLPKVLNCIDSFPTVKIIVYVEHHKKNVITNTQKAISLYTYTAVCDRGKNLIIEDTLPDPDDVAVIIFTKATIGLPKGVILTQRNLVSAMKGYQSHLHITNNDIMIGYLPLSNIMELLLEMTMMMVGGSIGYSSNLINPYRSMKVIFGVYGDATVLQPTVMFAYPQLMKQFSKSITAKIQTLGIFSRNLVNFGITYKKFWTAKGFRTPITNRIIFSRITEMIGGKVRIIICGGAHLPAAAQLYSTVTLCCPVLQSYILSENAAAGLCQSSEDLKMGQIGKPLEGVYVRLGELSGNYHVGNKQMAELILGGDCVSQGYINLPVEADNFYTDGGIRWFHTGDAAIMHQDGSYELIDQKSDIIKLEKGKCVPLGKLESIYRMGEYVENIYLHGNEGGKFLVSILIPDKDYISRLALSLGLSISSFSQMYSELTIKTAVADLIAKHAKSCKLSAYEIPAAVMLVDHEWTIDSGLLTTNHRLKRSLVYEKYEAEIAFLYDELSKSQSNNDTKREIMVIAGE